MRPESRLRAVVGNWKLNGSLSTNEALLAGLRAGWQGASGALVGVCVPSPYLSQVQTSLSGSSVAWGAQDVSAQQSGAFTGEVSAQMVAEFGARLAIVGHSERRALFGDTDASVAAKFGRAQAAGLTPILCVGETLAEREAGRTNEVVSRQLAAVLDVHGANGIAQSILAYEPVWAIGTGKTATAAQAQEVHAHLRSVVAQLDAGVASAVTILYGGSVKASNAAELFACPDVDGGLVGGASLVLDEFLGICRAL